MFHAAGWTFPWVNVLACAKQASGSFFIIEIDLSTRRQITLRTVDYSHIWHHFLHSGVTHYCGAPTVQVDPRYPHL